MKFNCLIVSQVDGHTEVIKCLCPDEACLADCSQAVVDGFTAVAGGLRKGASLAACGKAAVVSYLFLVTDEAGGVTMVIQETFPCTPPAMLPAVKKAVADFKCHQAVAKCLVP